MSGLDASFLYFETPTMHMHVLGTVIIDPSTAPHGWSASSVRDLLNDRLDLIPPFRRRLLPAALRLHHPVWVDVPDVDVAAHLTQVDCPAPGGMADLAALVADFAGRKLDRSRPLWEVLVVDGLEHGRVALVFKVHHSAVDGVGAAALLGGMFDLTPQGRTPEQDAQARLEAAQSRHTQPAMLHRLTHTATGIVMRPLGLARLVPTAVRSVTQLVRSRTGEGATTGGAAPFDAPRAPFNGRISSHRVVAYVDIAVADVKAVKKALGGTFNDVLLTVCGGAFRSYLAARDALPDSSLVAVCPVSVRSEGAEQRGNAVSAISATLGTDLADPRERLAAVHCSTDAGKADLTALGGDLLEQAMEFASPTMMTFMARVYSATRLADLHPVVHNVVISNIAGPPVQLYLAGGAIEGLYPLGPVLEGPGLNITVVSYLDRVGFGFIACAERMPDVADLAAAVPVALAELVAAAG